MIRRDITIMNRAGIHARPASMIVQCAQRFESSIWIEASKNVRINAKSIMNILTLGAVCGTTLVIAAEGPDETEAAAELAGLFESKFKEE